VEKFHRNELTVLTITEEETSDFWIKYLIH